MRIAIFTDSFFPGCGGTEKAVLGLADALTKLGNQVAVCCPRYGKDDKDDFSFLVFRAKSIKVTKNDRYGLPGLTKSFKKNLNKFAPDIIHCQTVSPMTSFAIKYAKKHNIPVVSTIHTNFKTAFSRSIKSRFIVNLLIRDLVKKLNKSDSVTTVGYAMAEELKAYGYYGNVDIIKNGAMFGKVDDVEILKPPALKSYGLENEHNILLFVGHIVKFKNLQFTMDALKIISKTFPDFKMLFVGAGLDDNYFRNYAKKIGINDKVLFTGQITDKEMLHSLYSISDLFVFPSIFDTDGLVIVEAAVHKVPSITLKNTGASERITDNVSGFIEENDVNKFANRIIEILKDKKSLKEIGENAEKMIPKSWETTAKEYLGIYHNLLNKK